MLVKEILQRLDLGSSVAEFDAALETYFVETQTSRSMIQDKYDIVAGDKGTGKTALFRILQARASQYPELRDVRILPAFNPKGSPVFLRLTEEDALDEERYAAVWKTYVLALISNWLLETAEYKDKDLELLERVLTIADLRSIDTLPVTVFSRIVDWSKRKLASTKSVGADVSLPGGVKAAPKLEFEVDKPGGKPLRYEDALGVVNRVLEKMGLTCWVALDRLDEAFQGKPAVEIPALRALFRVYLDLSAFSRVRLKLFVRRDLFRKVTQGGFVNLTHVNARKIEIRWDEEDLKNLLCERIRDNRSGFLDAIGLSKASTNSAIFEAIFPRQVDTGEKQPETWAWMMSRIRDGNGLKPPRNLIDLVQKAQEAQTRREERESNTYNGPPIIASEALKRGLEILSEERVNDTLLAEVGEYATWIEKFRDGKSEHNETSLAETLGVPVGEAKKRARILAEIGFLEPVGDSYKIPMLYRDGLNVTQGKAF
jgi:hypothetical protein